MKVSRVKIKDSNISVFVISAESKDLMMIAQSMMFVAGNPTKYKMLVSQTNSNVRAVVVNDSVFKDLDTSNMLLGSEKNPVDLCVNAHIVKWKIKTKKPKPKDNDNRFKIEVE